MKFSTLYFFITSVPSEKIPASFLEEVSLLSFPDVKKYLEMEEKEVPDSLINKILAKSKA